jgi:hypothetical protein
MNCQRNINSTLPTQLSHKFSYIVAILGHNHFESPNTWPRGEILGMGLVYKFKMLRREDFLSLLSKHILIKKYF